MLSRENPADDETLVYRTCGQRRENVGRLDVCIGRERTRGRQGGAGERIGWEEVNSMSTDLFLLPAGASRSNRSGQTAVKSSPLRDSAAK